jgi:hypothetical protein
MKPENLDALDWLTVTFPHRYLDVTWNDDDNRFAIGLFDNIFPWPISGATGRYGFNTGVKLYDGVFVFWGGVTNKAGAPLAAVVITGEGLKMLRRFGTLEEVLSRIRAIPQLHVTRIDVQKTVITEYNLVTRLFEISKDELAYTSRLRRFGIAGSWGPGFKDAGFTFYAGRRTSGRFFRVYDKHAEDPEGYPQPLTFRLEVEYKQGWAVSVFERLFTDYDVTREIFSVFVPVEPGYSRSSRAPVAFWWLRLAEVAAIVPVVHYSPAKRTLGTRLGWIERAVKPSLQTILDVLEADPDLKAWYIEQLTTKDAGGGSSALEGAIRILALEDLYLSDD